MNGFSINLQSVIINFFFNNSLMTISNNVTKSLKFFNPAICKEPLENILHSHCFH